MNGLQLVVFDMAGTTIEDAGQVPEAFRTVLARRGMDVSAEQLRAVRGASKRDAIRQLVREWGAGDVESLTESLFNEFRDHLAELFQSGGVRPIAGALETFDWLRSQNVRVALGTGFDRLTTDLIVDAVGWKDGLVDAIVCGDDVPQGRPAPYLIFRAMEHTGTIDVRQVACVGDTVLDLQAGNNSGAGHVIGVLTGAHRREQLEGEPNTGIIASVGELPAFLSAIAGDPILA